MKATAANIQAVTNEVESNKTRSAWAYGGSGLVYDNNIVLTLCTVSERTQWHKRGCPNMANPRETWLDVEARAARQAWRMIAEAVRVVEA